MRTLMTLRAAGCEPPDQERSGTEATWCYDRKPPCLYATLTQEPSRRTARIGGGKCARQQRLITGRWDEGLLIPMKEHHA